MRLLPIIASVVSVLAAAGLGMVWPAAVEAGVFSGAFALVSGVALLCVLAWGLSLIATPEDESC